MKKPSLKTRKITKPAPEVENEKERFGERLVAVRKEMHLTQQAFSDKTGIPLSTLKNYEGSHSAPGAEALAQLMRADINVHYLLSGEGPKLLTLLRLRHATNAVMLFVSKRSSVPESQQRDMSRIAFEKNLDEDGVEREFAALYPTSRGVTVDTARLTLAIETVEKGLAQTGRPIDPPGRAELIATVYDMLADPADPTGGRILKLLKLANP